MQRARRGRVRRPGAAPPIVRSQGSGWTLGRVAFALVVAFVVCSLLASGVGYLLLERPGGEDGPAASLDGAEEGTDGEAGGAFEGALRATIEADPNDAAAMASLANLLATTGRPEEAIDWYDRALAIDPGDRETRLNFGTTLADGGKRADAEVQFRRLMEQEPTDPDPVFYLAELCRTWEPPRTEEAAALYRRVTELAPDAYLAERAREELGRLEGTGGTPAPGPVGNAILGTTA